MSEGAVMSFQEHLTELRTRLIRMALVLMLGFFVCWQSRSELFSLLAYPIKEALADNGIYHFQAIHITESVIVYLKTSLVAAIALTSPYLFYQMWAFVSPGLLTGERRLIVPVTIFTVIFFGFGFGFAYNVILPFITDWLVKLTLDGAGIEMMVTLQNAYATAIVFLLMFGFVFELPLVIFFLALTGAVTHHSLLRFFRYFVVLSFIVAAFFTPPDPISQLLMAVPLNVLYGFGILVAWLVVRARKRKETTGDEETSVGVSSLRLMGGGIALTFIAGCLLLFFIGQIPDPPLVTYLPSDVKWAVGINATVVHRDDPDLLNAVADHSPDVARCLDALVNAGVRVEKIEDVVLYRPKTWPRGLMIRGPGLGDKVPALKDSLEDPKEKVVLTARQLDDDSFALGAPETVATLQIEDPLGGPGEDPLQRRLMERLQTRGPAWIWFPAESPTIVSLAGPGASQEIQALGAVLEVGPEDRLTIHLVSEDRASCDALETRVQAARERTRGGVLQRRQEILALAVSQLTTELGQIATPAQRARLAQVGASLDALTPEPREGEVLDLPALTWIAPYATGWALRQHDNWLSLTTALDDQGASTILKRSLDR